MSRTKKPIENQSPIVSPRERQLLDKLADLKRTNTMTTVNGFCKDEGYANKSALRHFPVLRRELSLYVAQFAKPGHKRSAPSTAKFYEVQLERQNLIIARLKQRVKTIPELKTKIATLKAKAKQDSDEKTQLRGMLSTVIAFLSGSDLAKARDLSERLEKQAKELLEDERVGCIEQED